MPRKPKDVYVRIKEKEEQITQLKLKLESCERELLQLNKERESLEMTEIFRTAKEHNIVNNIITSTTSKIK